MVDRTRKVKRRKDLVFQESGRGLAVLDPERGVIITLNETGRFIFELLKKPRSTAQIVEKMTQEFDVSYQKAEKDAGEFLRKLRQSGCLEISR